MLSNLWNDLVRWFMVFSKSIENNEPKQIESPHKAKAGKDIRALKFKEAFDYAVKLSKQGIEENKDKGLIRDWWAEVGKRGYTEKTPWCTLGIHIPLLHVGLLTAESLPRDIALARGYIKTIPKGFKFVPVSDLEKGDIAIKWRGTASSGGGPNGWMGHIGWFDGYSDDGKSYYSVGGNQSNKFNRKAYSAHKLLGGVRVIGDSVDTIEEDGGVDMSVDNTFIPERFRSRAKDMAKKFLLAKETRNSNDIKWALRKIKKHTGRYKKMEKEFGLPWQAIAAIHYLESSIRFDRHLHNGDPLTARTVRVPSGRPKQTPKNNVAYTFEESAKDVFTVLKKQPSDWTLPNLMFYLESYNGMGYFYRGLNSPYLVSGTQFQQGGKFVADGKFDRKAYSKRAGAFILMKKLGYEPI